MQLASRSYLAAGVALIGAGAIAVSPMAPPAPDIHLPAFDASSAAVNLTAAANPLQVWADVIGTAFENVSGLGGQLAADPAPILRQIIANQLHSANVMGAATQRLVEGMSKALDPDEFLSFPAALKQAFDLIAAGDYAAGFAALPGSLLMLGLPLIDFVGNEWVPGAWSVIAQPFTNLSNLVTQLPEGVPALLASGVLSPLAATAAASGYTLENLVAAANSGDAAAFVSTLVNSPATITGALLNGFEYETDDGMPPTVFTGLLNAPDVWGTGGAISTVLSTFSHLADALATPGADRGDLFGNLPGLPALDSAPETVAVSSALAPTAKTVTLDVAPAKGISATPAASQSSSPADATALSTAREPVATETEAAGSADTTSAADAGVASTDGDDTGTEKAAAAPTKVSAKTASAKAPKANNSAKAVRDQVKASVKKLTNGLKKDKAGTEKKADSSADSAKGADK